LVDSTINGKGVLVLRCHGLTEELKCIWPKLCCYTFIFFSLFWVHWSKSFSDFYVRSVFGICNVGNQTSILWTCSCITLVKYIWIPLFQRWQTVH